MAVLNILWPQTGQVPNTTATNSATTLPTIIFIQTNDTLATATVAGYLNKSVSTFGNVYNNSQMALVYTTDSGGVWLRVTVATVAGVTTYSLVTPTEGSGTFSTITLAVGSAATPSLNFSGDTDTGIYHSAANTVAVAGNGALIAAFATTGLTVTGLIAASTTVTGGTGLVATTGTVQALAGNVIAGSSANAASLISFPASAANGTLIISALNAGGAFNTTIRNSVMGQSTVYSLGDIGAATGGIPVATSVFVMKSVAGAVVAGGAAATSVTDTFCTSGSMVVANWNTQTNAASILKIVPGNGSFVVTSSADPGSSTLNYIITK